jgi:hypothetical protein
MAEISIETYEAIMEDAHKRCLEYQRSVAGRAMGQTLNEKDNFDWWVLTSAYQAGLNAASKKQP